MAAHFIYSKSALCSWTPATGNIKLQSTSHGMHKVLGGWNWRSGCIGSQGHEGMTNMSVSDPLKGERTWEVRREVPGVWKSYGLKAPRAAGVFAT